jgi:hypothetical protein
MLSAHRHAMHPEPRHFALTPLKLAWHHFSNASFSVIGMISSFSDSDRR